MDTSQKLRDEVKAEFTRYLIEHNHRKTPERYAILDHIYSVNGHFDMDSLFKSMIDVNFRVSRATLYNTMELLLDCGLVIKHQFGANVAKFERTRGNDNHDHIICTTCGTVRETTKEENLFRPSQQNRIRKFTVSHYSLYIYGTCSKCMHVKRMEERKRKREEKLAKEKAERSVKRESSKVSKKSNELDNPIDTHY